MPLLIGMLVLLPLYPFLEGQRGSQSGILVQLAFSALIALGVMAVAARPRLLAFGVLLAAPAVVLNFLPSQDPVIVILDAASGLAFFLFATVAVTREVVRRRIHPSDLVTGGIAIYLLIGFTFMHVYRLIGAITPEAFVFSDGQTHAWNWADYLYYSFVTLTTLGFGDIRPVARFAESVSISEAIIGPLFIAVFIASLLHIQMRSAGNPQRDRDRWPRSRGRRE